MRNAVLLSLVFLALGVGRADAKLHTETVDYKDGDATLEGYLAYDDAGPAKKPGVVVVHDWLGISAATRHRVDMLAQLGYVAFAADIYGKGVRPTMATAGAEAGKWKQDRAGMRRRAALALAQLEKNPHVDATRLAAIGYCFGGTVALELARSGAPLVATVTFHGGLDTPTPADAKNIKGRVLALHGADDPHVPPAQVAAFEKEMRDAKVDWQLIAYGGAVHAFSEKGAGNDNSKGAAYNERADHRSWLAMQQLFTEAFSKK
ncbi:MAG: dienelactone hydrolase family protein [Polyangia bacterium]